MFDTRELATILAALLFWSEEISPSRNDTARHYLKPVRMTVIEPLTVLEIQSLSTRLRRSHRRK